MSKFMDYKGYFGSVEVSLDDNVLHGKIECINDLVTYEAENPAKLRMAFEEAVEDYLETCEMLGKAPDKTMSGTFNIRIGSDMHKQVYLRAKQEGVSINELIKVAINEKLADKKELHMHYHLSETSVHAEEFYFEKEFSRVPTPGAGLKLRLVN
ncbi:type II toxin-antitoxin system HicB family antitoxin [Vibrio sp. JC009]|uniref:type II toxin-antitoxin system HicB family antitoxin n=1 Tax=Vibrio sp. JC009 TaxID=2912314 RepID=UPI0023AFF417|nr:type II toxin-antitoxin system HicB family antitoxin [Vibrio sp. JC009]WED21076.1 type II toxin-antitoxin system HicB family antitoxin [Vibrio sp. JC009]